MLLDAEDRERLRAELASRKIAFSETPLFKVAINGRNTHQLLKAIETPLSLVQVHQPSLEDAYLSIIGGTDD